MYSNADPGYAGDALYVLIRSVTARQEKRQKAPDTFIYRLKSLHYFSLCNLPFSLASKSIRSTHPFRMEQHKINEQMQAAM